jgi:hypothetical protein
MRLDRDAIGRAQVLEVERRHDRDDRRGRRLMAADLDARVARAQLVGVVDDAHREPQHAPLDGVEHVELAARLKGLV